MKTFVVVLALLVSTVPADLKVPDEQKPLTGEWLDQPNKGTTDFSLFHNNDKHVFILGTRENSDGLKKHIISHAGKFTKSDVFEAGLSLSDLRHDFRYSATELLLNSDYSAADLRHAGYNLGQLLDAKFSSQQLVDAGYNAEVMKALGYRSSRVSNQGYSAADILVFCYGLQV
jgi:hypothetical protein